MGKTPHHKMHGFENMSNFVTEMMNNPDLQSQWKNSNWRCKRTNSDSSFSNTSTKICIPLRRFNAEQVQLSMNKSGLVTVTASKETTEDSTRNGQRKCTVMIEETCQLPGYLVDGEMSKMVDSKFHCGFLVITFPEDPKVTKERETEGKKNSPIDIPIMMEE